jgi:hypothetical protein
VSTAPVDVEYASSTVVIHHASVFNGTTPADCGASGVPSPRASEWAYVTCEACRALVVHARRSLDAYGLCGAPPGEGWSTTRRSAITCPECIEEIERRTT